MLAPLVVGALLLLLAGSTSSAPTAPQAPSVPPGTPPKAPHIPPDAFARRRVLLVGDSLAVGLAWPLALRLEAPLTSAAIGGTRIAHWHGPTFAAALASTRPGLVIVVLGTNDIAAHATALDVGQDIAEVVWMAREHGAAVAWVLPPSLPWPGLGVRAALARELAQLGVPAFDTLAAPPVERSSDRIHMTLAGYDAWAAQIAAWLDTTALAPLTA